MSKFYKYSIALLMLLGTFASLMASNPPEQKQIEFSGGEWQIIVDGQPGEGAPFYRLDFKSGGKVEVLKQCGGKDNIVEDKLWKLENGKITIQSEIGATIKEFDGTTLILKADNMIRFESGPYKGIMKPYHHLGALGHWILILIVLVAMNEIFRRFKWANWMFYLVVPLILTPLVWSQHEVTYWFKWVKVYSVVFAVLWFNLIRYTNLHKRNWVKMIAALFLAINIAEAVSQDFSMGYLPNILNGVAGVLNIATLFYGWKQIGPDKSKEKDMVWMGMPVLWIVAYDVWNIVYVYLNFPGSTSAQFMVILACTIPALYFKKGTWLQARAFTLAAWFMYYFTFPRFTEQMELLVPRSYNLLLLAGAFSLILNIVYAVVYIQRMRGEKKEMQLGFK